MKILVTGVNGQLGHDVMLALAARGHQAIGSGSGPAYCGDDSVSAMPYVPLDITDGAAVFRLLDALRPDAVIHCSAWTAVDAAEDPENAARVRALNVDGPTNLARACRAVGAKMLYISTDYVFDGSGERPWQPDDLCFAPLNRYGQTKLAGEFAVAENLERFFIVRTSWVFGKNGRNFVRTMLHIGRTHSCVRVVNDQIGTPTYTQDLARLLVDLIETDKYGYYHATNEGGYISWYDFTKEIFRQAGISACVLSVSSAEYGAQKATRPFNSRLDKSKLDVMGLDRLPPWQDALARFLTEIGESSNGTDSG